MKKIVLYISEEEYRQLKAKLALAGKNVSAWFRDVVRAFLDS